MDGIYENIEEFNPNKKRKTVIFIRGEKLRISFVFIAQSYF